MPGTGRTERAAARPGIGGPLMRRAAAERPRLPAGSPPAVVPGSQVRAARRAGSRTQSCREPGACGAPAAHEEHLSRTTKPGHRAPLRPIPLPPPAFWRLAYGGQILGRRLGMPGPALCANL